MNPTRSRATAGVDRSPQNIPLTLGNLAPIHHRRRLGGALAWLRLRATAPASVAGIAAALAGILLALARPPVAVSRTGNAVRVGDSLLIASALDPEVFRGDATLVIRPLPDGTIRAAASMVVAGSPSTGVCVMTHRSDQVLDESCSFNLGSRRLTAIDHLDVRAGPTWRRRYADGVETTIAVDADAAVVPVPFPIGR